MVQECMPRRRPVAIVHVTIACRDDETVYYVCRDDGSHDASVETEARESGHSKLCEKVGAGFGWGGDLMCDARW